MNRVNVYGASDDLIEVMGAVNDELYAYYQRPTIVRIGDWKIEVTYDVDGEWRLEVVDQPHGATFVKYDIGDEGVPKDYSEMLSLQVPDDVTIEKVN